MSYTPLKSNRIVDLGINLLTQEVITPGVFWRVAESDFTRTTDDTVTIRVPAYGVAKSRTMRSGSSIDAGSLAERGVDLKIDTHIYHRNDMNSESLTLDLEDFGREVLQPQAEAVARGLEDKAVTTITGATYQNDIPWDTSNPQTSVLRARRLLNGAKVPQDGRFLMVGAAVEENLLGSELLTRVDQSGSSSALRSATVGQLRGFLVVSNPNLPDDTAIAFHRSAFALATRAPVVPSGAAFGSTASSDGFSMRWLQDYDNGLISDRSLVDVFCGSGTVTDNGTWSPRYETEGDDTTPLVGGSFTPSVDPSTENDVFIRAVKLTVA